MRTIHVPVGKDGDGAYTASTKGCFDVIDEATPSILRQLDEMPLGRSDQPFHIADYGTADAGTSLGLLTKMIQTIRNRDGDNSSSSLKEILIHYEDQHTNEWKSVFNHALGYKSVTDAYGNNIDTPYSLGNVFVEASGVGFHKQCYTSGSIDFGLSFTAMHWLSASKGSLRGTDYMHAARCPNDNDAKKLYEAEKEQAAKDWLAILQARSKEMAKGGRFCCVNFCKSKDGYFLGQTYSGVSMWDSFQSSWNKLKDQGLIDEEERLGVSFPNYYRSAQEFIDGIEQCSNLRLISVEEKIVLCPYREQYIKDKNSMSPEEYARSFVPTTRSWSHSTFKAALHSNRSEDEKERILNQFWLNYEDLVAEDPENHGMDYVHSYLMIEKI